MSTEIDYLRHIGIQINIYFGLTICVMGTIGNMLNTIVFTTLKAFRETTCATYLITASISNLGQSLTNIFWILTIGFNILSTSVGIVCKFRYFFPQYFALISHTCICMVAIDQFLSLTQYRHLNTIRSSRYHIIFSCILAFIHVIFVFIYYNSNGSTCILVNSQFFKYYTYFYIPFLLGCIPLIVISIFALLALYKLLTNTDRQITLVRLSRDRQLTAMALAHATLMIITSMPYIVFIIYSLDYSATNIINTARYQIMSSILPLIAFINFACPFYVYCCVSRRFRKQVVFVLVHVHLNRWRRRVTNLNNNQVTPFT